VNYGSCARGVSSRLDELRASISFISGGARFVKESKYRKHKGVRAKKFASHCFVRGSRLVDA
jgi:hypothetical protein